MSARSRPPLRQDDVRTDEVEPAERDAHSAPPKPLRSRPAPMPPPRPPPMGGGSAPPRRGPLAAPPTSGSGSPPLQSLRPLGAEPFPKPPGLTRPAAGPVKPPAGIEVTSDATTSFRLSGPTPVVAPPGAVPLEPRIRAARDLLQVLKSELEQHPKPMRAGRLHFETGRLHESPLGEFKDAVEAFLKAHSLLGDHLPSIRGARRTLLALGRAQEALPLFDAELRLTAEPEQKAQVLYDKASVLEDLLGQKKEAREALEIAAELGKGDATRVKSIERAEALARAWEPLSRALERESNAIKDDARHRSALIAARARLLEAHRGDPATAVELYQSAADGYPNSSALHALKRLHYGHQRWRDLITVLEREAELAADAGVRALSYYRVGRLWLDRLGNVDEALDAMERAASEGGDDPMILEELARLYDLAGRHADLALVLERLADRGGSRADQLACFMRLGELHETRLFDDSQAIIWFERARALDRCYIPVLQALSALYMRRSEFQKLVDVHAGEAEGATDPARRAAAFARVAELYETNLGRADRAMHYHSRALGVQPGYASSFNALVRLLSQACSYPELVELYERAVDQASDAEGKVLYLYKIGRLYEDALSSPAQALVAYRRILEIAPNDVGAVHSMQRSAERAGLFKELIEALELEAERISDKRRKLELYHRAGEVAETDLNDDALAVSLFKRVVEIDKSFAPAYASLGHLFYKAGRWEELVETYRSELRLLAKGSTLSALHFKIGQICEERLGHEEDALVSYRRAVEADRSHRAAVRALERKLEQKSMWDELAKVLEAELAAAEEPKLKARTLLRIGEVCENHLRAPEKALVSYEQALALDSELAPARDGRIRLLTEARDYRRLVEELEREARAQRDGRLATWALLRAGEVYRDDLGDPSKAVRSFEAALERDPSHIEALLALEPLYAERGTWDALANVYAAEARVLSDKFGRVAALRELGRLQQSRKVMTPDNGRQAYGAILQLIPGDIGALFALERIALECGDGELLAHVDSNLAATLSDPVSVATHETRLGELLEAAGDPQALEVFRAALARDAEGIGAARGLSRIAERTGDPVLLAEAAEREARVLLDVGRAASGLIQAGERLWSSGDFERAKQAFARALEIDPDHELATARISELLLSLGEVDRLLALLTRAAGAAKKVERAAALWASAAELLANRKHDMAAAIAVLQRAQVLHPTHTPILVKLADLYGRDGQWSESVERLKSALAGKPDTQTAIEANFRLGMILDEHLDDPAGALGHLEAVLSSEPNHRGALGRLSLIQLRRGQLDQAAETAQRLVRMSPEINARVVALTLLGRVERQRGQFDASAHAYEQAVAVMGVEGTAAKEFRELVATPRPGDNPTFSRYLSALIRYVESTSEPPAAAFVELARTLSEHMNQPDQALSWLERGLSVHSGDLDLRANFAERLLRAGQYQRAASEFERVVALEPKREAAWRHLADALSRLQRSSDSSVAIAPLIALGFANDLERATWSTRVARTAGALPGSFGPSELTAISPRVGDDPAARLIAALGDISGKVFPPDLDRWGVSSRERVGAKSGHPTRSLADRLAAILELGDYELYIHRSQSYAVELELTDPVSVLVPASVAGMGEAEQAFLLGRALATAARGLAAVERLPASMIEILLAAAARLVEPNFAAGAHDEESLSAQARKLSRALPWLGRTPIEDAAKAYVQSPLRDPGEWIFAVKVAAARAAALLADDLPSSFELARRLEAEPSGVEGDGISLGARLADDLLRFWVSESAFLLRRRLGLG